MATKEKIISILVIVICLISRFNIVKAAQTSTIEERVSYNSITNYTIDTQDENEVAEVIKGLILTINSEGMNKNILSQTLNVYSQVSETYTNNEIVEMIEKNKEELENSNVKMDNVNSVMNLLKNIDTKQLNKIVSQVDVDEIYNKIENGESTQSILKSISGDMTTYEKVNFIMDLLLSANIIKLFFIIVIILFVYRTLLRCVIYKKAGQKAYAPFIPIYRNVVMLKICKMSPWWLLLLFVPILGWIILWVISVASKFMLAEAFGKGTGFAFGLWLLAPIFETSLVFSKSIKYEGFEEE